MERVLESEFECLAQGVTRRSEADAVLQTYPTGRQIPILYSVSRPSKVRFVSDPDVREFLMGERPRVDLLGLAATLLPLTLGACLLGLRFRG